VGAGARTFGALADVGDRLGHVTMIIGGLESPRLPRSAISLAPGPTVFDMTARKKLDALIDETATRYFEGMTGVEREITAIDTTLTGLMAVAKVVDRIDRRFAELHERLDSIDERLTDLEASNNSDAALDALTGGLGLLRKRIRKLGKKKRK
jgi:hypothetical protein